MPGTADYIRTSSNWYVLRGLSGEDVTNFFLTKSRIEPKGDSTWEERKQKCMGSLKRPPFEMVLGESSNMFNDFLVKGKRRIPLMVTLINRDNKRFDDFSSLDLNWESNNLVSMAQNSQDWILTGSTGARKLYSF